MSYRVGITAGVHFIGNSPELSTPIRKIGFALTRGADMLQMDLDYAYEVAYTDGADVRHIAKKQGMLLAAHGDLNLPIGVPERGDWRDAFDRMSRSVQSAVFIGAAYVDFHASLNIWLELLTYTSHKLTISYVDHLGRFISWILFEEPKLRKWFTEKKLDAGLINDIMTAKDNDKVRKIIEDDKGSLIVKLNQLKQKEGELLRKAKEGKIKEEDMPAAVQNLEAIQQQIAEVQNNIQELNSRDHLEEVTRNVIKEKLASKNPKERSWDNEDIRGASLTEGHLLMFHYLFYRKDKIFEEVINQYKVVKEKYKLDYNDDDWPDDAWRKAEEDNDKEFKEFFYGVVSAKYLEGLLEKLIWWTENKFIKEEIPRVCKFAKTVDRDPEEEKKELTEYARNIIFAIENPEARQKEYGGLHLLWRPKAIYAAVKAIRRTQKTERVWLIIDHEHISTQGNDAFIESREIRDTIPDYGSYVIAVHANHPNPLHLHDPVEHGDDRLYELLFNLRKTGFGRSREVYIVYERGGGEDPYQRSVDALKVMAQEMEKDTDPKKLPLEFYGLKDMMGDTTRQWAQILSHRMDPIKDLLELSEEDWGLLGKQAREKGRAEAFKKGEFR